MESHTAYRSYLLRLRRLYPADSHASGTAADRAGMWWRISLQEPGSDQERFFSTLDELVIYLAAELGSSPRQSATEEEDPA